MGSPSVPRFFQERNRPGEWLHLNTTEVEKNAHREAGANTIRWMRIILFALGGIFVLVGLVRQWPILGKTYMQFIEGNGYLPLMLGLIMIVLGFSVRLFMGEEEIN